MSLIKAMPFMAGKKKPPKQKISASWEDREIILAHDVNLFCWQRSLDKEIEIFLKDLLGKDLPPIRCSINSSSIWQEIAKVREEWDALSDRNSDVFWRDVHVLVRDFLNTSGKEQGTVYLRLVDNNACRKFHTDGYQLRLFSTYVGKGTEWLPEEAVNRSALGTENEHIVKDQLKVQQLGEGDVGILKGEIPDKSNRTLGIVHRSPQIAHIGEKRIILRVDL